MRIGAFEVNEPLPRLREPHAIVTLEPWVNVGNVGLLALSRLEAHFRAGDLAKLVRPGNFFDFTRYRPTVYSKRGRRAITVPNTSVTYAKFKGGKDFLFFHLLEPHMLGEAYVDSIWGLLKKFGVKRYGLIGSMYDIVPHSRPLLVTGAGVGKGVERGLRRMGVGRSDYQGPTSIVSLVPIRAAEAGIETFSLIVHLPQYTQLDDDYMGLVRLMGVLNVLYGVPIASADIQRAERQHRHVSKLVERDSQVKEILAQLEAHYDAGMPKEAEETEEIPELSPEVEKFLREMDRRFREG